jgi:hypothetical protein
VLALALGDQLSHLLQLGRLLLLLQTLTLSLCTQLDRIKSDAFFPNFKRGFLRYLALTELA